MSAATIEKVEVPTHFKLKGQGKPEKLKTKDLIRSRDLQARKDVDPRKTDDKDDIVSDGTVDEARAQQFADAMENGTKFPALKVIRLTDEKLKGQVWIFDGLHTHRGAELAGVKELDCVVWEGTKFQALQAAATIANREHETNGKPLSNKDKLHSLHMLALAYTKSEIPKKEWPTNRQAAAMVGISHTYVNQEDPFGRKGGSQREQINAAKRTGGSQSRNGTHPVVPPPPVDPVTKAPCNFEVVNKNKNNERVGAYFANSPAQALERHMLENHSQTKADLVVNPIPQPSKNGEAKPGSEKSAPGFDWAAMEQHMGWVSRALPAMCDIYGLKNNAEYAEAVKAVEKLSQYVQETRKKLQAKK